MQSHGLTLKGSGKGGTGSGQGVKLVLEGETAEIRCKSVECTFSMGIMGAIIRFSDFVNFGYFTTDALNKYQRERDGDRTLGPGTTIHAEATCPPSPLVLLAGSRHRWRRPNLPPLQVPSPACEGTPAGDAEVSRDGT
jgi:hypothetical protein